jgi:hypothetical protein
MVIAGHYKSMQLCNQFDEIFIRCVIKEYLQLPSAIVYIDSSIQVYRLMIILLRQMKARSYQHYSTVSPRYNSHVCFQ